MGRPLYSSVLLSRQAAVAPTQPAEQNQPSPPGVPTVEKWSQWNAFDPDSDEFFQAEDAVYEAFLTEQQITALQAREAERVLNTARLAGGVSDNTATMDGPEREGEDLETDSLRMMRPPSGLEVYFLGDPPHDSERPAEESFAHSNATDSSMPLIIIAPSRVPSPGLTEQPGFSNLVSGLPHLSESPQPIQPVDPASRPVSPIPNTPARISGIFTGPSSSRFVSQTPSSDVTPRLLSWGSSGHYSPPYRATRLPGDQPPFYRHPPVPSPLTS